MIAATVPFLFTDLLSLRQFGIAVAVAVLIDALLVRPVVLPAAVELLGRRAWWPTRAPAHPAPPDIPSTPAPRFSRPTHVQP
jgi:RND superfamily putative drug exporter